MRPAREIVLGIDFGSSSTVAGALVGDRIELVPDNGDKIIPSVVYLPDRGAPEVGRRAQIKQMTDPSRVVRSIKRVLGVPSQSEVVRRWAGGTAISIDRSGDGVVLQLRSGNFAPEQIVAAILSRIRELAETRFGAQIRRTVMTTSADAHAGFHEALRRAARIAHLEIVELIAEPIAGALALDLHRHNVDRKILVCDFGGGTFDVSAVVQEGMRFRPVALAGDHWLGGDDLDWEMAEAIAGWVVRQSGYDMHKDVVRWNELLYRCETAKRQLSSARELTFAMPEAYLQDGKRRELRFLLDTKWAEGVWSQLLGRVRGVIAEGLARAGWSADQVDVVGLIGGSSLTPAFRRMVSGMFSADRIAVPEDAETAVAIGATILTARHQSAPSSQPTLVA